MRFCGKCEEKLEYFSLEHCKEVCLKCNIILDKDSTKLIEVAETSYKEIADKIIVDGNLEEEYGLIKLSE